MKRRTLDFVFVIGGLVMASLMMVLGFVLNSNANFAKEYVKDQLSEQEIYFTPAERLQSEAEWRAALAEDFGGDTAKVQQFIDTYGLTAEAATDCLVRYGTPADQADRLLDSGEEAECYANEYIRLHLKDGSIIDGQWYTYASIGGLQRQLRTEVAEAKATNAPNVTELEQKLAAVNAARDTLLRGESLRGLLLTSYGFSIFGEKADQAATVLFLLAIVLFLASIAGLVHALVTPKDRDVHFRRHVEPARDDKELVLN